MKVIHIISGGDTGGAKTSVITLLKQLQKVMDVKLVCFMEGEFSKEAINNGINVQILQQKGRFDLSVVKKLINLINKEGYDIINCHGARANFIGTFFKNKVSIPLITTIHSDYNHDFDNKLYKKIIFTMINRSSLKRMDGYIAMAEQFKKDMVKRGFKKEKIHVAYNGISMNNEDNNFVDKEKYLKQFNVPFNKNFTYVGTATRLHPVKGIEVLLKGAKYVKNKNSNIKFLIAGYGDEKYTKKCYEYVKDNNLKDTVFFLGFIKKINEFYKAIDINTITSHSEAVCYALLEGGKYSLPSVASKVGGIPELIQHGKDGLLFNDNDYVKFGEYVIKLSNDKDFSKVLGKNLYNKVLNKFSDVVMAKQYQEIYKIIIERFKKYE